MARYYRRYYKNHDKTSDKDDLMGCIAGFFILYIVGMVYSIKSNPGLSALMFLFGVGIFVVIKLIKDDKRRQREKRKNDILNFVKNAGLHEYINNFISRFGLGQEKDSKVWSRRNYKISWSRINDLKDFLEENGIELSSEEISSMLADYVDQREYNLTVNSISSVNNNFNNIKWDDFERLIYRLYESMGYSVQLNGRPGDQGGDVIATKGNERILIQAKFYKDWTVGNKAVQESVAAKNHYDCNKAVVITTSVFTQEATELAKTNGVDLISKSLLQKMLMDNLKESWN